MKSLMRFRPNNRIIVSLNNKNHDEVSMGLRDIGLKEEYRSDRDDIVAEFFFPCLSHCIEYDRCVDFLSIQSLATIAMAFDNFSLGKAKLRMITGHRFKNEDLNIMTKLFSEKYTKRFDGKLIRNTKIDRKSTRLNSSHSQQSRMPSSA